MASPRLGYLSRLQIRFVVTSSLLAYSFAHAEVDMVDYECLGIEEAFARNDLATLTDLTPLEPEWLALQQFRLAAIHIPAEQKAAARTAVRAGLKAVNATLREDPDNVAMLLMGAMLDGQYLLVDRWRFFHNGLRGLRRLNRAEKLAPTNPRAALIRGTAKVVLPKFLGGGAEEAKEMLQGGLEQKVLGNKTFVETRLCEDGQWAQVDLLNWLGRAYSKLKEPELAADSYRQALQRSPSNHWVKLALSGQGYEWADDTENKSEP